MTEPIAITGMRRIRSPKPNQGGSTVLAFFDCEARGLVLCGSAFVRTGRGGLTVWPPKLDGPDSERRSIAIADDSLRHAIMLHAREAYRALGGTDAEWVGRSIPMGPRFGDDDDRSGLTNFINHAEELNDG